MPLLSSLSVVASLFLVAGTTLAQESSSERPSSTTPLFGFHAESAYCWNRALIPVYTGSFDCGQFESQRGVEGAIGGELLFPLFSDHRSGLGLRLMVGEEELSGRTTPLYPIVIPVSSTDVETGDSIVPKSVDHEYRLDYSRTFVRGSLYWSAAFVQSAGGKRLLVQFGPGLDLTVAESWKSVDYITDDLYRFPGGVREAEASRSTTPTSRFTPLASLHAGYRVPLGEGLELIPSLQFDVRMPSGDIRAGIGFSLLSVPRSHRLYPDLPPAATLQLRLVGLDGIESDSGELRIVEEYRRTEADSIWHVERRVIPPILGIHPDWSVPRGLKGWSITFLQGEKVLGTASDRDPALPDLLDWSVSDSLLADSILQVRGVLAVTDSTDRTITAGDTLHFALARFPYLIETGRSGRPHRITLPANPNHPDLVDAERKIIRQFADDVPFGTVLTIRGGTPSSEKSDSESEERRSEEGRKPMVIRDREELQRLLAWVADELESGLAAAGKANPITIEQPGENRSGEWVVEIVVGEKEEG